MNIIVFGGSGATGQEIVRLALTQGFSVTAFVRDPGKLKYHDPKLRVVHGDVKDYTTVERAMQGNDAVLSALGVSKPLKRDPIVVEGVRNIIRAMEGSSVRRLIYLSVLAVREGRARSGFLIRNVISRIVHNEIADHEEKEKLIASSRLEWTIVRPPKLTNGPRRGNYRFGEDVEPASILPMISRADVADFMLRLLKETAFVHKAPGIMY